MFVLTMPEPNNPTVHCASEGDAHTQATTNSATVAATAAAHLAPSRRHTAATAAVAATAAT